MNIGAMVDEHEKRGAEITVAAYPVDATLASEFGVIEARSDGLILGFHEKQSDAPRMLDEPERVYASMGNYIFNARILVEALHSDAKEAKSHHDFGRDILPALVGHAQMYAYEFKTSSIPGEAHTDAAYWRDVGTVDAYYEAQMDLCSVVPSLNLYNRRWPIRTASYPDPSAKFTSGMDGRPGQALGSIVSGGCVVCGGIVLNSILGRGVNVDSGAIIEDSIVFDNCRIGPNAKVRRSILDENTIVPAGAQIGYHATGDRDDYDVSPGGIVLVT